MLVVCCQSPAAQKNLWLRDSANRYFVISDIYICYPDNIPVIELPVRAEYWTIEEILTSFIEAITQYFAWLTNTITDKSEPDEREVEEVLQANLSDDSK